MSQQPRVVRGRSAIPSPPTLAGRGVPESKPSLSIVVPGLNESQSLSELADKIDEAVVGRSYELIFVDDGSTDETWEVIGRLCRANPAVRGVRLRANFGKAAALAAGFEHATGQFVISMDADLQDDPAEIPKFVAELESGFDVVVGWRVDRQDSWNRRFLSRIFNASASVFTGVALHDMNCGLKGFRREVVEAIPIYGDLYRFIPALAKGQGFSIVEVPVTHHPRRAGRSRYGMARVPGGFFDLLSVAFLVSYSRKPMHFFGLVGLSLFIAVIGLFGYSAVSWIHGQALTAPPLLLLGAFTALVGVQLLCFGLVTEFLAYHEHLGKKCERSPVREVMTHGDPS